MKQNPKNITTEIIRDYPSRFYLDETELNRLIADISSLLKEGAKLPKIRYWVGLENGIIYETQDLKIVIAEENAHSLTIRLLIVFAETFVNGETEPSRRIIVHFSRGRFQGTVDNIHLGSEWFNVNYEGISYRIKDKTRNSTLKSINTIEERLLKFRRWYSNIKILVNRQSINYQLFVMLILSSLFYSLSALLDIVSNGSYSLMVNTNTFLEGATLGAIIVSGGVLFINAVLLFIKWLIPPTVIAIGDEITQSKKKQKLREYVFWSVIVAALVGVGVNLLTK